MPALAVVPAAGAAERFGSEKLSAKVGDVLLLERTIRSLLDGGVERIVVVLPPGAGLLRDIVNGVGEAEVRIATNRRPERGMFSSIQEGLKEVTGDPILVLPADMPFVEPGTIHLLLVRQREAGGIVSPRFEGKRGHPVVFPRALRDEIVTASDGTTLHDVLKAHASERVDVDVYDRGVIRDVDEPKDLEEPAP